MLNVLQSLSTGARCQQAGQLAQAEQIYRQVLDAEPGNAEAWHRLGTMALQDGRHQAAIDLIGQALFYDRSQAVFHANLGEAYRMSGNLDQALACTQNALALDPGMAAIHANLGNLNFLQGNLPAAIDCLRDAVKLAPEEAHFRISLGELLRSTGQLDEAVQSLEQAVRIAPDNADARARLALALYDRQDFARARVAFEAALAMDPNNAAAHNNLGNVLKQLRLLAEAEIEYRHAIRLDPRMTAGYINLGGIMAVEGRHQEAAECFTTATTLDPQSTQAFCNLVGPLEDLGRLDEAVAAARRAIELAPDLSFAHSNLGICLKPLGRLDEAIAAYRVAVDLDPASAYQRSNLIYALNFHGGYDAAGVFAEHRLWGQTHADALTAASAPHTNDRTPNRRLRLGYVSGHFWEHAVNFFSEPILAAHDHGQFEVFCYANATRSDEATKRLRGSADQWREITHHSDEQAAELVRRDQIDILVDLTGHIAGHRLLLFAHKPAPVQVTYLGYQNTTGMAAMDYRLTDEWSDPSGTTDPYYTEKLVRLPGSFFCYQPSSYAPPVGPLPALANGYVTFGSFNNFAKVTPEVLAAWAQLLNRVSDSRLVILASAAASLQERLLRTFEQLGISSQRLILANQRPRGEYLDLIAQTDVALDPFPFNGHTTTCDALWQGVPVVTLAGGSYASRFGSSAHQSLGLEELIAHSPEEYVEIAVRLAGDLDRLAPLRAGLRPRMAASRLLDFAGFTRNLEAAYRTMWNHWCASGT